MPLDNHPQPEIDNIQTDIGDPSARSNDNSIEEMIGVPDAADSTLDDQLRAGFDSSAITSDRDGSIMERAEDIKDDTTKIDETATSGLAGVSNSLAYRTHEIEHHFHSYERWMGAAAAANGEIHVADPAADGVAPFSIDAGNNVFGAWVQLLGSSDTPIISGSAFYDVHRMLIESIEKNEHHVIQIGFGASGAAAISAGTYTELMVRPTGAGAQADAGPSEIQSPRQAAGTLAWARVLAPSQDTSEVTFFIGVHEYEG